MIISCPACATRFNIDLSILGDRGRKVRCAGCGHVWHQSPPGAEPEEFTAQPPAAEKDDFISDFDFSEDEQDELAFEEPAQTSSPPSGPSSHLPPLPEESAKQQPTPAPSYDEEDDGYEDEDYDDEEDEYDEEEEDYDDEDYDDDFDALDDEDRREEGNKKVFIILLVVGLLIIAALATVAILAKDTIVENFPSFSAIYGTDGATENEIEEKLSLRNTQINSQTLNEGGVDVLFYKINGEIMNMSEEALEVPGLKATVLDGAGEELNSWTFKAETPILLPGEKTIFQTSLRDPHPNASDVSIKFDIE